MNMRKLIAVLVSALLLCAIIPMSAISVSADGSFNFENGTVSGWQSGCSIEVVDDNGSKVLKFDASGADWANVYYYGSAMVSANTDYTISFRAKADRSTNMNFKVNNNWAGDTSSLTVNVTTEWQEYSEVFNSGACTSGALLLFSSNTTAANGATYYIDDIVITEYSEPVAPGTVTNGDFEKGDLSGWEKHQSTTISTDAHSGSYAANVKGNGGWGGMLNQNVPVTAGKSYEISLWAKVNSNGVNVQIKDGGTSGADIASKWYTGTSWTQLTWTVIPTTDVLCFNFCGGGNGIAEDVLIDDITVTELKDPSFDGYITNGDFEIGKAAPWNLHQQSAISAEAAHSGDYGLLLQGAGASWGGTGDQAFTVEVGKTYVVHAYVKAVSQGVNIQIQNPIGTTVASQYVDTNKAADWKLITLEFTATATDVRFNTCCSGISGTDKVYIDDVFVFEKKAASNDGYIVNGDFETGTMDGLSPSQQTCVSRDAAKDGNFGLEMLGNGGWGGVGLWTINGLEAGATYKFEMDMNAIEQGFNWTLWQDRVDSGAMYANGYFSTKAWTHIEKEFVANSGTAVLNINGGGNGNAETVYLDNLSITLIKCASCDAAGCVDSTCSKCGSAIAGIGHNYVEGVCSVCGAEDPNYVPPCEHEYFYPCDPVCMKCYEITNPDATHTIVAVEAVAATCTENGNIAYWYCSDCGSAWADEALTQMTNQMSVIVPAAHTYVDNCDMDCDVCGEWRDAPHNLTTHVEEVIPANCQEEGCSEYWICADCGGTFADNGWGGYYETNPAWLYYTGDHVRPEGAIVCAIVPCELCGEDTYGEACDRGDAPVCQDAPCVNCGEIVWGWGCNYNTGDEEIPLPLCQPGTCVYCGTEYEYLYECENGAWAPCQDGECSYGCGKQYPATENHVLEDCTVDGYCQLCWSYIEAGEHTYANAFDVDCDVCGAVRSVVAPIIDVKLSISEDVSGLAFRFEANVAGFAIKAGTFVQADYTNATYNGYKLIETGAVASNGVDSIEIKGERMCDLDENGKALFAYRIINIPADKLDVEITMVPYYIVEIDGVETTIYGDAVVGAYAEVAIG